MISRVEIFILKKRNNSHAFKNISGGQAYSWCSSFIDTHRPKKSSESMSLSKTSNLITWLWFPLRTVC